MAGRWHTDFSQLRSFFWSQFACYRGQVYDELLDDSVHDFDRVEEFRDIVNEYSVFSPLTRGNFGSLRSGPGGINLHIGWQDFAFKGGFAFITVELWVCALALRTLHDKRQVDAICCSVHCVHLFRCHDRVCLVASPFTMSQRFSRLRSCTSFIGIPITIQ